MPPLPLSAVGDIAQLETSGALRVIDRKNNLIKLAQVCVGSCCLAQAGPESQMRPALRIIDRKNNLARQARTGVCWLVHLPGSGLP